MLEAIIQKVDGGVTAPKGFTAAGVPAGIKNGKKDVAVIFSEKEAAAAGVFTINKVKAAPVLLNMEHLKGGIARAIVANSGNANACNGVKGMEDARSMALKVSELLQIPSDQVLVGSTGVIGQPMPMDKVLSGIQQAAKGLSHAGGIDAANAIMTTDTVSKEAAVTVELGGVKVTLGGMAKGSGMIHPNMATMLGFITTDAAVEPQCLKKALDYVVERTFNMISVDGDTSTNDMVLILANGQAGNHVIDGEGKDYDAFCAALELVCRKLAMAIARDGEGATRMLEVQVLGMPTEHDARLAARGVTASNLVKSAIFGKDANWGRVICALGYSGAEFNPDTVDIHIGDVQVAQNGASLPFNEEKAAELLDKDHVVFKINCKAGDYQATAWGCDLTYEYVRINGSYRT